MKRKGFTLIELLAVIVVLAIIAIIAIPVITGVIDNSKKGAFKSSVLGMMEAADLYRATNTIEYGNDEKVVFECNGSECSSNKGKLSFKGEVPTSGQIIMYKDGRVEAYYLQNREYCARGERTELNIQKDCFSMDDTNPELEVNFIKGTTNEIIINVKAVDLESGIKKITYEIDGKLIEENYIGETNLDVNKIFDNLGNDKTYSIKVTVENRNEKITESTVEGTTLLINSPGVGVEAEEVEASGYYINQVVNITYDNTNIESPEYFVRTTRSGVSSINIDAVCGEENEPTECEEIEETTILEADKWYKVSGDLKVSYSELSTNTGTIYATIYDGTNYITTTGVILKTTVKTAYKVNHHQMNLDGTNYTLAETEELTGYANIDATPNTKTYEGFTSPTLQTVYLAVDGSTVVDYYYTRNQYTVTLSKGTGIDSVSGDGSYYYGEDVTTSATLLSNTAQYTYGWSKWTGDKTATSQNYTFEMPASDVTLTANGTRTTNSYTQVVQVRYQNADGTYGAYSNVINQSYSYGSTVSWSRASDATYNAASITSYSVTGEKTTQVSVTRRTYTVTVNKGTGIASVSGAGTYRVGQSVTVGYTLSTGYVFSSWSGTYTTATFTMPTSNVTMQANGKAKVVTVVFNKNDGTGGTASQTFTYGVSGNQFGYNTDGTAKWGTTGQFGAWDRSGYKLLGWSETSTATTQTYSTYSGVNDSWINSKVTSSSGTATVNLYAIWQISNIPVFSGSSTLVSNKNHWSSNGSTGTFTIYTSSYVSLTTAITKLNITGSWSTHIGSYSSFNVFAELQNSSGTAVATYTLGSDSSNSTDSWSSSGVINLSANISLSGSYRVVIKYKASGNDILNTNIQLTGVSFN